jgi:hypothetical protein
MLISVLSFKEADGSYLHFFIFQERTGDAIYMVQPFDEKLQRKLEGKDAENTSTFDEAITKDLHISENRFGSANCLINILVNKDFKTSLIISAS